MEMIFLLDEIDTAAKKCIAGINKKIWAIEGEMGVGKTTLIKAICLQMGVVDVIVSPTFSIINEYKTKDHKTIFHMDLYRIKDEQEAVQVGVEDCLLSGSICLIEWPNIALGLLPQSTAYLSIKTITDTTRKITVK